MSTKKNNYERWKSTTYKSAVEKRAERSLEALELVALGDDTEARRARRHVGEVVNGAQPVAGQVGHAYEAIWRHGIGVEVHRAYARILRRLAQVELGKPDAIRSAE